jgi:hypothetical protein
MGNKINAYGSILDQVIGTKLNKFLAPQQNQGGLLNFVKSPYAADIGMGLLAQSGYSTMPTSLGQSLGVATNQANQLRSQRRANDIAELGTLVNLKNAFQDPKQKPRDIRIAEYVARGIPRNEASDIVDGILEINLNEEGITTVYNPITKKTKKYGQILTKDSSDKKSDSSYISPEDLDPKTVEKEKGTVNTIEKIIPRLDNIMSRADNIFGTGNKFKDIGASVAGITPNFLDQYLIDPKVVTAKKDYKQIKKDLQIAMINSQRFPVFEQQQILDMLPDETSFFQDPQAGAIAIKSIKDRLQNKLDESISVLEGEKVTTDIMQGSGVQIDPFFPKSESDLMQIKSGQYFVYENEIRIMK